MSAAPMPPEAESVRSCGKAAQAGTPPSERPSSHSCREVSGNRGQAPGRKPRIETLPGRRERRRRVRDPSRHRIRLEQGPDSLRAQQPSNQRRLRSRKDGRRLQIPSTGPGTTSPSAVRAREAALVRPGPRRPGRPSSALPRAGGSEPSAACIRAMGPRPSRSRRPAPCVQPPRLQAPAGPDPAPAESRSGPMCMAGNHVHRQPGVNRQLGVGQDKSTARRPFQDAAPTRIAPEN